MPEASLLLALKVNHAALIVKSVCNSVTGKHQARCWLPYAKLLWFT